MSIPDFSLAGKVAIVTGGKRGIGKAIALAFAEAGADVAICGRVLADGQLEAVAEEIRKLGRRSLAIQADTSRKNDVENLIQKVTEQFGAIDILVNNAGIIVRGSLLDMLEEDWDKVINTDLKGYFLCAQAVGKGMVGRRRGSIINITSSHAFKVSPGAVAYGIAKTGVVMLTRGLAQELGSYGIRANAIAPILVKTDMTRAKWGDPEFLKKREARVPLGRVAEASDIVGAALFLASDASNLVSGHTILIDGGEFA